jgi:hypothetical protein
MKRLVLITLLLFSGLAAAQNAAPPIATLGVLPDSGPTLPPSCSMPQIYFRTLVAPGLYLCNAQGVWVQVNNRIPLNLMPGASFDVQLANGVTACGSNPCVLDGSGYTSGQNCLAQVTVATPGMTIILAPVTFTMGAQATCILGQAANRSGYMTLDLNGATFLATATNQIPISFNGGQDSGSQNLSVDARLGTSPPTITTAAAVSGLAAGDYFKLADTNTDAHVQSVRVLSIGACAGTCVYNLDTPIYDDFFVLAGGKATRWLWNTNNIVKNGIIDCANFTGGQGMLFHSQVFGVVENVTIQNCLKAALYSNEGMSNNYSNLRFIKDNGNASAFSQWEAQTQANISNVQAIGMGVGGFDFNFKQVHASNISNPIVSNGYGNGRTYKYYRSTYNSASNIVLENCGNSGGVQICFKIERSSFKNVFWGASALSGYGVVWAVSDGSSYNECHGCFLEFGQQGIVDGVEDFSTKAQPVSLTVTVTKTGSGSNCTATFVRSAGNWAADANSHYDNRGLIVYFAGFTNAANNYPANTFLVTSTSTTTLTGDTLNVSDPRCVTVNETSSAAAVSAIYAYPSHGNKFIGGTIGYMRGTSGTMINVEGNDWVFDGVKIADDNGIATAGLTWRGQGTNGPGGAFTTTPTLNLNPSDGYFGQRTHVVNNSFSGFPTNFDIEFGQTGSTPTNEFIIGNATPDGIRRINQGTGNVFLNNIGDMPPLYQNLAADSSGITAITAGTAVTQFAFATIPRNAVVGFHCSGTTTQATAGAGIGIAIQSSGASPTNLEASATVATAATTTAGGSSGNITTTTYTAVYTGAAGTLTTQLPWTIDGQIETGATKATLNIGFFSINAADAVTVKRGSYCALQPIS